MHKIFWVCTVFVSLKAFAIPVTIDVVSHNNTPVFQTVVYLEPEDDVAVAEISKDIAVMDQVDRQFMPHILAVQKGSKVVFPNSDSIKHHVYSFSPAKQFELKLYKGSNADPLLFDNQGEVELGCNVHDWMLAYIWVVDTPYFAKTSQDGKVTIDVPKGHYKVKIWHPRIQDDFDALTQMINVDAPTSARFSLKEKLLQDLSFYEQQADKLTDYE
ncbi:methylamine utilization protein [Aliiglaciecola sp. 2_MG-2023]|uniref:methylamine utilization protein n=1 Tax=unclassified Aliiglaciecola TaxID=2593648 RepID=UPI0026E21A23|nr:MULTISPECIES: methylamine utilization protein [unclassified Aliiglaciecola]MDO6712596.1 methylamine utilization protein [Aliiglaciecola sp. 2_MG-2023]MDO6753796.1 methylamine utilization protein [Aliiglaciecola sp. 1_MG-2023]